MYGVVRSNLNLKRCVQKIHGASVLTRLTRLTRPARVEPATHSFIMRWHRACFGYTCGHCLRSEFLVTAAIGGREPVPVLRNGQTANSPSGLAVAVSISGVAAGSALVRIGARFSRRRPTEIL